MYLNNNEINEFHLNITTGKITENEKI